MQAYPAAISPWWHLCTVTLEMAILDGLIIRPCKQLAVEVMAPASNLPWGFVC